ncbi:unnamed protein product [Mortierella alpina]
MTTSTSTWALRVAAVISSASMTHELVTLVTVKVAASTTALIVAIAWLSEFVAHLMLQGLGNLARRSWFALVTVEVAAETSAALILTIAWLSESVAHLLLHGIENLARRLWFALVTVEVAPETRAALILTIAWLSESVAHFGIERSHGLGNSHHHRG